MMGALMLLVLAVDLPPPPTVEVAPQVQVAEPEVREEAAGDAPEWDLGAQVSVSLIQSLNGVYLGIAACGATTCYYNSAAPLLFGALGAGAGFALSLIDRELARDWGRAALVDSITVGAGLLSLFLATRPELSLGQQTGYSVIFVTDVAITAAAVVLAKYVSPRPETVWLADTLGLWGILLGASAATLMQGRDIPLFMLGGALAGAASGALLGASAQRMTLWRVLLANGAALLGALVLGGGLSIYESMRATPQRPYDPAVPAAGLAAGIAGGFLLGFTFTESL
jgi:hypothetical protein